MSRPALELRTGQHLALTPQLQQSIRLLQLSTLDLDLELSQALADNPLLEREDEVLDEPPATASDDAATDETLPANAMEEGVAPLAGGVDGAKDGPDVPASVADGISDPDGEPGSQAADDTWDSGDGLDDLHGAQAVMDAMAEPHGSGAGGGSDDDDPGLPEASVGISLRDHLLQQLHMTRATERDRLLVACLIDELDDNGYLASSLDEIMTWFVPHAESVSSTDPDEALGTRAPDPDELRVALRLLQSFDPPGVGAADLSECLMLQLRATTPKQESEPARVLALEICRMHLPLLATGNAMRLRDALGCDETTLRGARALILALDPRPGRRWTVPAAAYAVPDVVVKRVRNTWRVSLNAAAVPKLRVNALYAQMLGNQRASQHAGLQSQLQQAKWMIRNVEQRFETILKVSQAIVDRQSAFLSEGPAAMRPLILKDIASEIGMHESTISRATTQKYMLTPFGTMELKRFFGSGVATDSGDAASATAVQAFIRKLVEAENRSKPLSDNQITQKLAESGIVIARRTVAKYRETLRIQPASLRRAHAAAR